LYENPKGSYFESWWQCFDLENVQQQSCSPSCREKNPKMEMIWPRIPWWPWHNFENVYSLTVWSYPPCFIKIQQQSLKIFPSLLLLGFMTIKQWDQWAYNHCVIITDHYAKK
jgi:hypothetical protein